MTVKEAKKQAKEAVKAAKAAEAEQKRADKAKSREASETGKQGKAKRAVHVICIVFFVIFALAAGLYCVVTYGGKEKLSFLPDTVTDAIMFAADYIETAGGAIMCGVALFALAFLVIFTREKREKKDKPAKTNKKKNKNKNAKNQPVKKKGKVMTGPGGIYSEKEKQKLIQQRKRLRRRQSWAEKFAEIFRFAAECIFHEASTAQKTLRFKRMYKDGICKVTEHYFTKTLKLGEITYQLADNEDRRAILDGYRDFHNLFDPTVTLQIGCYNQLNDLRPIFEKLDIPQQNDGLDAVRKEVSDVLKDQLARGDNGRVRTKLVTFGVEAANVKEAKIKLEAVERDAVKALKDMGVTAEPQTGFERLQFLYQTLNEGTKQPFRFKWDMIQETGLSEKDFIAPRSFDFRETKCFKMGDTWGQVMYMQILAPEIPDTLLSKILDTDDSVAFNIHVKGVAQAEAIKFVKNKLSSLDAMKIDQQMKASQKGYDPNILPADLVAYANETKEFLEDLQGRNEKMFLATILVMVTAPTKKQLGNAVEAFSRITNEKNCPLVALDFQQEEGLVSSLPLGLNMVDIQARTLTTTATAIMVPFTTEELFQSGEALWYGINAMSNNMIMCDRKLLDCPNGLVLGTPGKGKSTIEKICETVIAYLKTNDDFLICDPEGEYPPVAELLGGAVVDISSTSKHHLNPMDININYGDEEDPINAKAEFVLSLCSVIMDGITPLERTIIDRATHVVYERYFEDPVPERMPTLGDLYDAIKDQPEDVAQAIAGKIEIFVTGSLNVFNHRTNVNLNNRLIVFNTSKLGEQLKTLGMLVVQDFVWNRVSANRRDGKFTRYSVDEFHLFFKNELTAQFSVSCWKRLRKWNGIPTGLTQNVKDLLESDQISNIFENSDFIIMLNQRGADRDILADALGLSHEQLSYITNADYGEGLIKFGKTIVPFRNRWPKDTEVYRAVTTKPSDLIEMKTGKDDGVATA